MNLDATTALLIVILAGFVRDGLLAWRLLGLLGERGGPFPPIPPVEPPITPPVVPPVVVPPVVEPPVVKPPVVQPPVVVTPPVVTPPVPPVAPTPGIPRFPVTSTDFAGPNDSASSSESAYDGHIIRGATELAAAVPYHFPGTPPAIRVFANSRNVDVPIKDVGPWNTHDAYWDGSGHPLAESQYASQTKAQNGRIPSNPSGLDLTPAVYKALGFSGDLNNITTHLSWDFVSVLDKGNVAPSVPVSPIGPTQPAPVVPTGDNHLKVLTDQQCRDLFGAFTYTNASNGDIIQDPAWVAAHIVDAPIPQLTKFKIKSVKCHKLVAPWLIKAFAEIEAAGLLGTILSYDGLWVPRHINHNPSQGISRHSYGAAMDVNANWNSYGTLGAKRGTTGSTWEIEPIMAANGFACGRWFGYPHLPASDTDAMHLEWVGPSK